MKKIISSLLALCVAFGIFGASLVSFSASSGSVNEQISWVLNDEGVLTISGEGHWAAPLRISLSEEERKEVKKVVIEEGMEMIDDLHDLSNLTTVILPESLVEISFGAFMDCPKLTNINLENVNSIGSEAFSGCSALKQLNFNREKCSVGWDAFYNTGWYNEQPDGFIYLTDSVIYDYKGSVPENTYITFKDGIKSIVAAGMFEGEKNIIGARFPVGLKEIPQTIFECCENLREVIIPKSVTRIDLAAFFGTSNLTIYYEGSEEEWNNIVLDEASLSDDNYDKIYYNFDLSKQFQDISFPEGTYSYDATEKSIEIAGNLPEGAKVTYENAKGTNAGTYEAKATVEAEGYKTLELSAVMKINPAPITVTADDKVVVLGGIIPELTYSVTNGKLFADDKLTGALSTDADTDMVGDYSITKGTLSAGSNYDMSFELGTVSVVDKTPQNITVSDISEKTYGDTPFIVEVTPDEESGLTEFTFESSNTDVAEISADGTVTIKAAGETDIIVKQAGNEEYAATEKMAKLVVKPVVLNVVSVNLDNKTAELVGVLDSDKDSVELDFDNVKTTVISSEKSTAEETTSITTTLKVTNFKFKGEKAKNYVADKDAYLTTTVVSSTVEEKLTDDENVTIEAASVDEKTIVITDIAIAEQAEVKKIVIDVTAIADTEVNTVAIPKTTIDSIIGVDPEVVLEITLKDGSDENKTSTIAFNTQALTAIQAAGSTSATLSISVNEMEKEELEAGQIVKLEEVATKAPVVYSLEVFDENGNSVASDFGASGIATVKLPYSKPAGNGNIVVKYLDDSGNVTTVSNPQYDSANQLVTAELGHFSEYLIYTEPVRTSGGGGGSSYCTIKFDTDGGTTVSNQRVKKNSVAKAPEAPTKDGFTFDGWYTDKELTKEYDFATKVTKSITLYAKWTETDKTKSQIILTIGDKTAKVFGEKISNDVAPKIVNDRTMLPARFVAENLGAKVEWDEQKRLVTISRGETVIKIYIDSDKAYVNDTEIILDSEAFIENGRTYTPLRFVAENLDAEVEWNEKTNTVIITK